MFSDLNKYEGGEVFRLQNHLKHFNECFPPKFKQFVEQFVCVDFLFVHKTLWRAHFLKNLER